MEAITIRKLPDGVNQRLRMRAAVHGRQRSLATRDVADFAGLELDLIDPWTIAPDS